MPPTRQEARAEELSEEADAAKARSRSYRLALPRLAGQLPACLVTVTSCSVGLTRACALQARAAKAEAAPSADVVKGALAAVRSQFDARVAARAATSLRCLVTM